MKAGGGSNKLRVLSASAERLIRKDERNILDSNIEHAYVHDLNGVQLHHYTGNRNTVTFSKVGPVMTHNHPNGLGAFSYDDIVSSEFSAVSRMVTRLDNGKTYEFSIHPTSFENNGKMGRWPNLKEVAKKLKSKETELISKEVARKGGINNVDFNELFHKAATSVFKQYGIIYTRKEL